MSVFHIVVHTLKDRREGRDDSFRSSRALGVLLAAILQGLSHARMGSGTILVPVWDAPSHMSDGESKTRVRSFFSTPSCLQIYERYYCETRCASRESRHHVPACSVLSGGTARVSPRRVAGGSAGASDTLRDGRCGALRGPPGTSRLAHCYLSDNELPPGRRGILRICPCLGARPRV